MIPDKIQPFFNKIYQKKDGENSLITGTLTCCNANDFEVFTAGEIKRRILLGMCLFPQGDILSMEVRCKKCGKVIPVFDSRYDGYTPCETNQSTQPIAKPISCRKCRDNSFSVSLKYEYPDSRELEELGMNEDGNTFTWIVCSLKCNACSAKYKNFVDLETG